MITMHARPRQTGGNRRTDIMAIARRFFLMNASHAKNNSNINVYHYGAATTWVVWANSQFAFATVGFLFVSFLLLPLVHSSHRLTDFDGLYVI